MAAAKRSNSINNIQYIPTIAANGVAGDTLVISFELVSTNHRKQIKILTLKDNMLRMKKQPTIRHLKNINAKRKKVLFQHLSGPFFNQEFSKVFP